MLILILPKTPMELRITVSFAQHGTCLGRYLSYSRGLNPLNKPNAAATEVCSMPTNRSLTARRNPRGRYKSVKQIVGQNNPRTGAPHPKGQNPEGTDATLLAMELAGTVAARDLLAGARIRGGDGYAYTVVNRQVNGNRSPLVEGAFLVHPHLRSRMGVGYFQGCRPVTPVSNPPRFLEPNP